ncbi:hypothetical protein D3C73_1219940 [compost metagenome]
MGAPLGFQSVRLGRIGVPGRCLVLPGFDRRGAGMGVAIIEDNTLPGETGGNCLTVLLVGGEVGCDRRGKVQIFHCNAPFGVCGARLIGFLRLENHLLSDQAM